MPRRQSRLEDVAPEPIDEERRPLLDEDHPEHGTITEQQAIFEDRVHDRENDPTHIDGPSTAKLLSIILPMYTLSFTAALDSTIVATLAGAISNSFKSFTLLSWLASGYLLGNAATQPLSGKLSDIYGRKAGVIFACTFFTIGTLMCGLAPSPAVIIAGRVIAGMGGGCLNTLSTFVASDLIPLRRRGTWQGFANLSYGLGMSIGGYFGGFVSDRIGWRYAFYIQVPLLVIGGLIVTYTLDIPVKPTPTSRIKRVDFLGAITLSTALVLLLLGLNSGGNLVPWTHPLVLTTIPLSLVSLLAFILIESRVASEPIIPIPLLLHRTIASALLTNWFSTMSIFATFYYAPIFFSVITHLPPTQIGIRLIPSSAGIALGSLSSGLLMRRTGRYLALTAFLSACLVAATSLIAIFFRPGLVPWAPFPILLLQGAGYGGLLTVTLLALLAAAPHKDQAVITSAQYAFRSTGSTIGIALAGAVFQNILGAGLWRRFGDVKGAEEIIKRLRDDLDAVNGLGPRWRAGVEEAYADALRGVWGVVLALAVCTAVASLCMREHRLHSSLDRK